MPKDRGTGQRNVDGLLEFRQALGMVAAEARSRVAAQQAARTREQDAENPKIPIGRPRKKHIGADDPRHALQENGDLPDLWYIDGW